jgi:hypothetical protein
MLFPWWWFSMMGAKAAFDGEPPPPPEPEVGSPIGLLLVLTVAE